MRFSDITGHAALKDTLRRMARNGTLPHALLLTGPPGTGKMLMARALVQYIHCENPSETEACGVCNNCRMHAENHHPDLHWTYPIVKNKSKGILVSADENANWRKMLESHPGMPFEAWGEIIVAGNSQPMIHVEEAREIVLADAYPPYRAEKKAFVIWLPERLQPQAANKLLKVIEEPSPTSIFILVADNDLQILPTIFSRVQRYRMPRLTDGEISALLTGRYRLTPQEAANLAPLCDGNLVKAAEYGSNSGEHVEFLDLYRDIMRAAYAKRVLLLRKLADRAAGFGREKIRRFLDYMARMARENFIANLKLPTLEAMTPDEQDFAFRFSPFVNHTNIDDFLTETDRVQRDIRQNANAKLALFDYFLIIIILLHRKH